MDSFFDLTSGKVDYVTQWDAWNALCRQHGSDGVTILALLERAHKSAKDLSACDECGMVESHQNHWAPFGAHDHVPSVEAYTPDMPPSDSPLPCCMHGVNCETWCLECMPPEEQ